MLSVGTGNGPYLVNTFTSFGKIPYLDERCFPDSGRSGREHGSREHQSITADPADYTARGRSCEPILRCACVASTELPQATVLRNA